MSQLCTENYFNFFGPGYLICSKMPITTGNVLVVFTQKCPDFEPKNTTKNTTIPTYCDSELLFSELDVKCLLSTLKAHYTFIGLLGSHNKTFNTFLGTIDQYRSFYFWLYILTRTHAFFSAIFALGMTKPFVELSCLWKGSRHDAKLLTTKTQTSMGWAKAKLSLARTLVSIQ